jgi:hypothetical protein
LINNRTYTSVERQTNINVRHSLIQKKLKEILEIQYGEENVSIENPFNGNKIDAVVRNNSEYIFYEVKTASTLKACLREALGQLFEYSFWPGIIHANNIVVVGEHQITEEGKEYINFLNNRFNIPISYLQINLED